MSRCYKWGWQIGQDGFMALTSDHMTMEEIDEEIAKARKGIE